MCGCGVARTEEEEEGNDRVLTKKMGAREVGELAREGEERSVTGECAETHPFHHPCFPFPFPLPPFSPFSPEAPPLLCMRSLHVFSSGITRKR